MIPTNDDQNKTGITEEQLRDAWARGIAQSFHRHFVAIFVSFDRGDGKRIAHVFSGFLLDIDDEWVIMTAGHCIQLVEEYISKGLKFRGCCLLDSAKAERQPIHFKWPEAQPWYEFNRETGTDFGALFISRNTRRLLDAESKVPLIIDNDEPGASDYYLVYGFPEFATEQTDESIHLATVSAKLTRTPQPDNLVHVPVLETFFGRKADGYPSLK